MSTEVVYPAGDACPVQVDSIDPDGVVKITFDWTDWLVDVAEAAIDASTFSVSAGGVVGDGVTPVTRKSKLVTPPAPILASPLCTVHVYVDTAVVGETLTVSNHVRAGVLLEEKSATMNVLEG